MRFQCCFALLFLVGLQGFVSGEFFGDFHLDGLLLLVFMKII